MPSAAWMREAVVSNGATPDLTDEEAFLDAVEAESRFVVRYRAIHEILSTSDHPQRDRLAGAAIKGARAHLEAAAGLIEARERAAGGPKPPTTPGPSPTK